MFGQPVFGVGAKEQRGTNRAASLEEAENNNEPNKFQPKY